MAKYLSDTHAASDPGGLRLSRRRFLQLDPSARGIRGFFWGRSKFAREWQELIDEHLRGGDSRAAMVFSVEPLFVGAYTDELDSTVLLKFPSWLNRIYRLEPGTKLLTVNTYRFAASLAPDLMEGERTTKRFQNFHPIIADFYSDDYARIAARKDQIEDAEWDRCLEQGRAYTRKFPGLFRFGIARFSSTPAV